MTWSTDMDLVNSRGLSISEMNPKNDAWPTVDGREVSCIAHEL